MYLPWEGCCEQAALFTCVMPVGCDQLSLLFLASKRTLHQQPIHSPSPKAHFSPILPCLTPITEVLCLDQHLQATSRDCILHSPDSIPHFYVSQAKRVTFWGKLKECILACHPANHHRSKRLLHNSADRPHIHLLVNALGSPSLSLGDLCRSCYLDK